MPFVVHSSVPEDPDNWTVVHCNCNPALDDDLLVRRTVELLRTSYGEERIIALAQPDTSVESKFDLTAIRKALHLSLPSAEAEGDKPQQLTNYRSEPTEVLARGVIGHVHGVQFPANPQLGKTNPNMPVLGFDGWGLLLAHEKHVLVLVQVKGTEDTSVPPSEAFKLAEECVAIPGDLGKIARALSVLLLHIEDEAMKAAILEMLEHLGHSRLPEMIIAPVVVRGTQQAVVEDLQPVRDVRTSLRPAKALGIAVSVGALLADFGRTVITKARVA